MENRSITEIFNERFKWKRVLFIAIAHLLILIFAFVAVFSKVNGNQVLTILSKIDELLHVGLGKIVNTIKKIMVTIGIIELIPSIILTTGIVLVPIGGFANKNKVSRVGIGLIAGEKMLALIKYVFYWLASIIGSIVIANKFHLPAAIAIIAIIILIGVTAFDFFFNLGLLKMLISANHSINEDKNYYKENGFAKVWMIILIISKFFDIISAISSGKEGLVSLFSSLLMVVSYILILTLMSDLKKTLPELSEEDAIDNKQMLSTFFGDLKTFKDESQASEREIKVKAPKEKENSGSASTVKQPKAQSTAKGNKQNISVLRAVDSISNGKTYVTSYDCLDCNTLNLFENDMNVLHDRFSVIGSADIDSGNTKCPFKVLRASIILDSLSNKKVIRVEGINGSSVPIKSVSMRITPLGDMYNPLGVYEDAKFDIGVVEPENKCLSNFGVILPDDTSVVELEITRVMFNDGLYWDSPDTTYTVSSFEKREFDVKLYMELLNK